MPTDLRFEHIVIDDHPPGTELDITLLADITGNGRPDIVIGGKKGDPTLFWYENPTWKRHAIATRLDLEAGGCVLDIAGKGRPDIVVGQQWNGKLLFWYECPDNPTQPWTERLITDRFRKYHDQAVGDVDGDGKPEILFSSQIAEVVGYFNIPDNPFVEPWPDHCCHIIAEHMTDIEGLAIVDIDGDGVTEILAGPNIFKPMDAPWRNPNGRWDRRAFAPEFSMTRLAVADLDADGRLEIVLAEGESSPARLAVCHAPDYHPQILRDDLFNPHSLELADFDGSGSLDIFVAEMGLGTNPNPKLIIYRNDGAGHFQPCAIQQGVPTHEAKVADLTGNGLPDIVGKPYSPENHVDIWLNRTRP